MTYASIDIVLASVYLDSLSAGWASMYLMLMENACLSNGRNRKVPRPTSGRESTLSSPREQHTLLSLLPSNSVVSGFPNFYVLLGPNVATGHTSAIAHIESQIHYVVEMVKAMQKYNVQAFQLRKSAEDEYNKWLHKKLDNTVWNGGCDSWYRLPNGKVVAVVSIRSPSSREHMNDLRLLIFCLRCFFLLVVARHI
jgi:hypothetical protein